MSAGNPDRKVYVYAVFSLIEGPTCKPRHASVFPVLPFLVFLEFLFFLCEEFLVFMSVFPSFPGILGVRWGCKIHIFFCGFPCLFPKTRKGRTGLDAGGSRFPLYTNIYRHSFDTRAFLKRTDTLSTTQQGQEEHNHRSCGEYKITLLK